VLKLSVAENDEMTIINQIYSLCWYKTSKANRRRGFSGLI